MLRKIFFKSLRIASMNYFFQRNEPGQLYILMFHQVNDNNSVFYPGVPTDVFGQICAFIAKRFNVIYLSEIEDYFKKRRDPAVIITFDDGHYDILENALPILKEYKLKFNINIVTESMQTGLPNANIAAYDVLEAAEKKEYVNNQIFPEPVKIAIDRSAPRKTVRGFVQAFRKLDNKGKRDFLEDIISKLTNGPTKFSRMLSGEDVVYLSQQGAEIGSHTHSHAFLPEVDSAAIEFELAHSKKILEDLCGRAVDVIAFPQGRYDENSVQKCFEAGYKYILAVEDRKNDAAGLKNNVFNRISLYHKTLDENLAKIFGFHQSVCNLKNRMR